MNKSILTTIMLSSLFIVAIIIMACTGNGGSSSNGGGGTVDPCGSLPQPITDVDTVSDLLTALDTAPAGSTVRLLPGTYYPTLQYWTDPGGGYSNYPANLVVKNGVTLAGSGRDNTTIVITNSSGCLFAYNGANLRDLTLKTGSQAYSLIVTGSSDLNVCNAVLEGSASGLQYGIFFQPWDGGTYELNISDTELQNIGTANAEGVYLDSCQSPAQVSMTADIQDIAVTGWWSGVSYFNGTSACWGSVTTVNYNCNGFGNNTFNVREDNSGTITEHCP